MSVGGEYLGYNSKKTTSKCKDQGMFDISYKIGTLSIKNVMCDLGASIKVMPLSAYFKLNIGPLKETCVVIQLVDRSVI